MPTDETRRLLRTFGVAVTNYEDAVNNGPRGMRNAARPHLRNRRPPPPPAPAEGTA